MMSDRSVGEEGCIELKCSLVDLLLLQFKKDWQVSVTLCLCNWRQFCVLCEYFELFVEFYVMA